jgi:hypothetical protein
VRLVPAAFRDRLEVVERPLDLLLERVRHALALGVERALAGEEDEVAADAHSLGVRPGGRRCVRL